MNHDCENDFEVRSLQSYSPDLCTPSSLGGISLTMAYQCDRL